MVVHCGRRLLVVLVLPGWRSVLARSEGAKGRNKDQRWDRLRNSGSVGIWLRWFETVPAGTAGGGQLSSVEAEGDRVYMHVSVPAFLPCTYLEKGWS